MSAARRCLALALLGLLVACGEQPDPAGAGGGAGGEGGGVSSVGGGAGGSGGSAGAGGSGGGVSSTGGGAGGSGGSGSEGGGSGGGGGSTGCASCRADTPTISCNKTSAELDAADLTGLAPHSDAVRGDLIGCAAEGPVSLSDAQAKVNSGGVTATNAVDRYRVAYRTTRGNGTGGVSTARIWLPKGVAGPANVVLIAHGSEGLADGCAPTRKEGGSIEDLALLFASRGWVAIASDYAGLGTGGVQGYLDNRDTGFSLLDSARALRNFVGNGATSTTTVALGHSQGGGAVLAAQALAKSYGPPLAAVVAFAPQYQTRLNSFGYLKALRNPTGLTISLGVSKPAIYVLRQYAHQINHVGPSAGGDAFPAAKRASLVSAAEGQCVIAAGGVVQANATKIGDLFEDTWRTQLLACVDGGPACGGAGQTTFDFLTNNLLPGDATGAKVLISQGGLDNVMPAAEEASCVNDKLVGDGVSVEVCFDSGAVHSNIIDRGKTHAVKWLDAVVANATPPTCPASGTLPACTP